MHLRHCLFALPFVGGAMVSFASAQTTTFDYSASRLAFDNLQFDLVLKNNTDYLDPNGNQDSSLASLAAADSFLQTQTTSSGTLTYNASTAPSISNATSASYFSSPGSSLSVNVNVNNGSSVSGTTISQSPIFIEVTNNSPDLGPAAADLLESQMSFTPANSPLKFANDTQSFTLDLANFSAPNRPNLASMPIHVNGASNVSLQSVDLQIAGPSNMLASTALPTSISSATAFASSEQDQLQYLIGGQSSNVTVNRADYSSDSDYNAVLNYVQSNVSRIDTSQFLTYRPNIFQTETPGSDMPIATNQFLAIGKVHRFSGDLPIGQQDASAQRGGLGFDDVRASAFGNIGTSASRAQFDANDNPVVGVQAQSTLHSEFDAHGVAFQTYRFTGATQSVRFHAILDGYFQYGGDTSTVGGGVDSLAGMAVFDAFAFQNELSQIDPSSIGDMSFGQELSTFKDSLLGKASIDYAGMTKTPVNPRDEHPDYTLSANIDTAAFTLSSGEQIIVLLDFFATSSGDPHASSLYLFDSLKFTDTPLTTEDGTALNALSVVPAPEPASAICGFAAVAGAATRRPRRRAMR